MATSPLSLAQFGQRIKAKHPEYGDMADEDLANRVLAKYPQYQDMVAPGVPKAPIPAGMQGPPSQNSPTPKAGGFGDTLGNVGTHLKNMVTGPLHAAFDEPSDPTESGLANAASSIPGGSLLLPAYRMIAKPTVEGVKTAVQQGKAGNYGLKNQPEYDAQGNYTPTMLSGIADAIPVAGAWSRNVENDAQQKGMIPALAGLGTDLAGPKVAGKVGGAVLRGAGKVAQLSGTTGQAAKLWASRKMVPGTPGQLLQSALKPGVKYGAGVGESLEKSIPDVLQADPGAQGVSGFAAAADKAKDAAYQPYAKLIDTYQPPPGGIGPMRPPINGTPIGDRINASIPPINRFESPKQVGPASDWTASNPNTPGGIVQNTAERAQKYNRPIDIPTVDALREDANAKLNAFYAKTGGDQNAALSSPETAAVKAIGDGARSQLYPRLETDFGLKPGTVQGMQEKFGRLSETADIANKREPVFARHDPVSLSQKIVAGHGGPISAAWNFLVQKGLNSLTNSDALVNSAIDRYANPNGTPLPPRPTLYGKGSVAGGSAMGAFGRAASATPLKYNPLFYSAANPPKR